MVHAGRRLPAIEVKSGRPRDAQPGLVVACSETFRPQGTLRVGAEGIPVEEFFRVVRLRIGCSRERAVIVAVKRGLRSTQAGERALGRHECACRHPQMVSSIEGGPTWPKRGQLLWEVTITELRHLLWLCVGKSSSLGCLMSEVYSIISDNRWSMYSMPDRISRRVRAWGRGVVFTPRDFLDLGGRTAVDQTLSRLTR